MTVRGIRNMNPGNIRLGESWLGLRTKQTDPDFCQFTSMVYGCRALLKLLRTYVEKRGCTTIRKVIERWAPPSENDTSSYRCLSRIFIACRDSGMTCCPLAVIFISSASIVQTPFSISI